MHIIMEEIRLDLRSTFKAAMIANIPFSTRVTQNYLCAGMRINEKK